MAYAAKKQAKIYDNQLKQCRRRERGISNETLSGRNVLGGRSPVVWGGILSDAKKINEKIYSVAVDGCQTMERHTTTNQKWLTQ